MNVNTSVIRIHACLGSKKSNLNMYFHLSLAFTTDVYYEETGEVPYCALRCDCMVVFSTHVCDGRF